LAGNFEAVKIPIEKYIPIYQKRLKKFASARDCKIKSFLNFLFEIEIVFKIFIIL
jgi:hypothetical protein